MIVLKRGDDYGPSVFLFVYVGWMICKSVARAYRLGVFADH
jgi:hypothetical protein